LQKSKVYPLDTHFRTWMTKTRPLAFPNPDQDSLTSTRSVEVAMGDLGLTL